VKRKVMKQAYLEERPNL